MKKILFYIIITHILTLSAYAAVLKDCSVYSKFNPNYFTCKTANLLKIQQIIKIKNGQKKKINL